MLLVEWTVLLNPVFLVFMVPIAGILVGGAVQISKMWIRHRERMAMIEMGMHPDSRPPDGAPVEK